MFEYIPIIFAIILGFVHFFSDKIHSMHGIHKMKTVSFAGGIFITYILLHLFPSLYQSGEFLTKISLVFVLIGFTISHVTEKHVFRYVYGRKLRSDINDGHILSFFIYHAILGITIFTIYTISLSNVVLYFIPIVMVTALSRVSMRKIYDIEKRHPAIRILLSISTLIGVFIASILSIPQIVYFILLGAITGTLLHIVISDSIPEERSGRPEFFILGVVMYTLIIVMTWMV